MAAFCNSKEKYACVMCKMIPKIPISFPCDCGWACKAHLSDHFVTEGKITCTRCSKEFRVSNKEQFKVPHQMLQDDLNNELYLNEHEKEAKKSFHSVLGQFEQKFETLIVKARSYEAKNHDHFAELRRQIDIQGDFLTRDTTEKIKEVWLNLIEKTKEAQAAFDQKLKDLDIIQLDFDKHRELINDEFRKLDLSIERIEALKTAQQEEINSIEEKLKNVDKLKTCSFARLPLFNKILFKTKSV